MMLKFSKRYLLIPVALIVFYFLFYFVYLDIKDRTINEFNKEQLITAQASSQGITSFFRSYTEELTFLARLKQVVDFNDESKKFLADYYESHKQMIETVTRVDNKGRILYTYPYNDSLIGSDISYQKHIKQIMAVKKPVISDVFMSVQGFLAVALHVPVFKDGEYAGSIAILVKIDELGKEYLGKLKFRGTGSAWIITENNIEIFCNFEEHIGKSYLDVTKKNPAAVELTNRLKSENMGTIKGIHRLDIDNDPDGFIEKYIVFYRVPLNNTYWTILISFQEDDIYAAIANFRNRLVLIFSLIFVIMAYYFYSLTKVRTVLKEESKRKETEKVLKESENKYRTLVESINDGVMHTDLSGKIQFVNKNIIDILGYSKNELVGKLTFEDVVFPEDRGIVSQKRNLRIKGVPDKYEIRAVAKSGNIVWLRVSGTPLHDNNGAIIGSVGFFSNITERKRAEEEVQKISHAVKQSPVTIVITDKKGIIEYVNPKFEELTGYSIDEAKGKNPNILKSGDKSSEEYKELWETIIAGKEWSGEFHNKKKNGELYWEKATISPLKNSRGEITHFLAIKEDITEKKNIIAELILAKDKAEESSRLKSSFLANMSHEIRTPLNGILGFAELLKNELKDEEQIKNIRVIENSGKRLLETLNMILDFSKLEAEKSSAYLSDVRICSVINEVVNNFEAMARNKRLYIKKYFKHENLTSRIDERLLRHILYNLLKNAIIYTNTGGVRITFDHDGKNMSIQIQDTGVGIAKENFEMIFEPFRQESEGFGRNFEGTGLGLSIVKKYVEMLKGSISLESEVGKGSAFTVMLPINIGAFPAQQTKTDETAASVETPSRAELKRKLEVLIVENDSDNLFYVKSILKNNYNTDSAADGLKAIDKAKEKYFDIILMDINLGRGFDGIQTTNEIRKINGYQKTPVVAVTAFAQKGDREEFLANGCTHYIGKPFSKEQLLNLLDQIAAELQT